MTHPDRPGQPSDRTPETPTPAIRLIAMVAAGAAVYALSSILVPFLLALVLAIAMAPVAYWIERRGAGRTLASLLCMLLVAGFLFGTFSLIAYQTGAMLKDGPKYIERLGDLSARTIRFVGGEAALRSVIRDGDAESGPDAPKSDASESAPPSSDASGPDAEPEAASEAPEGKDAGDKLVAQARDSLRKDASALGGWAMRGLGGALGFLAGAALLLAFLFYMLQGRDVWIDRLQKAALGLGMTPRDREFSRVAEELKTYIGTLALVSAAYAVVITLVLWLIGVPQPLLWGLLTALLELVPFFGPVIAGALPTMAALGAGGGMWQPIAVVVVFVVLQTVEGYVVAPLLYGKAVEIDPVTVLFGVLFFGFLLGPAGLTLAMPLMILLRGVLMITPETPTLDALADADPAEKPR